jgi:periplasmic copper chaperone A
MFRRTVVALLSAALIFTPAAAAHVTINPAAVPAGSFARFDLRVPNERENALTTKVAVKLPEGLDEVSFEPKPGWRRSVKGEAVTWEGGTIGPGEFDEFGLSAKVPDEPGSKLTFPAVQTYSNREVVHWIGAPDADEPAPQVTLEAVAPAEASSGSEDGRANLALAFGIAGFAVGLLALGLTLRARRR